MNAFKNASAGAAVAWADGRRGRGRSCTGATAYCTSLVQELKPPHDGGMVESPAPARPRAHLPIVLVAVASCALAVVIQARARRGLGDEPQLLLVVGCVLAIAGGLATRRPLAAGIAAAIGFPFAAIVDMVRGGDHNLFPIEFALYGIYALGFALAAWIAPKAVALVFPRQAPR
jgi:hypothetical protein